MRFIAFALPNIKRAFSGILWRTFSKARISVTRIEHSKGIKSARYFISSSASLKQMKAQIATQITITLQIYNSPVEFMNHGGFSVTPHNHLLLFQLFSNLYSKISKILAFCEENHYIWLL